MPEAFTAFNFFKNHVEKESGSCIHNLHTDLGGEFISQEFEEFCNEHGIRHQLRVAYSSQQNLREEESNHHEHDSKQTTTKNMPMRF